MGFQTYTNGSELLLQSSSHPTIDFTATEDSKPEKAHLKHYVASFDPTTSSLNLVEAKKVTIRGQVRPIPKDVEDQNAADAAAAANATSNYTSRTALTETFGSKKSKRAVASLAENRLLTGAADDEDPTSNPLSNALMATMPKDGELPNGIAADIVQENKPLPRPNLEATTSDAVYPLTSLVFPSPEALKSIDVEDWQKAASEKSDIQTRSRFVASRVDPYAYATLNPVEANSPEHLAALQRLRLLRYLLILIELSYSMSAKLGMRSGKKVPPAQKLHASLSDPKPPLKIVEGIRRRFVPATDHTMRSFETQLLHTNICALTLHLPSRKTMVNPALHYCTEPSEIRDDLGVDDRTVRQYFRELGCRIDSLTETDAVAFGIKKRKKKDLEAAGDALQARAQEVRIAKLRMPLVFPRNRGGKPNRAR